MTNFIETGHAKNIATFEDLVSFCIGYGTAYNPANAQITIAGMQAKHATVLAELLSVKTTKQALDNATNQREILFKDFRPFATQIVSTLKSFSVKPQTVDDAKTILRKIHGVKAPGGKKKPGEAETPPITPPGDDKTISSAQLSYDSMIDHLGKMVELVTAEPLYIPNEVHLNVTGLNQLLTDLKAANTLVIDSYTATSNARIARNKGLYDPETGLLKVASEAKNYVKGIFGTSSPEYKQVSKLRFSPVKL